jgi:hypothetical protein
MGAEQIEVLMETGQGAVRPGAMLRGGFRLNTPEPLPVRRVELTVMWYTEGKGTQDTGVIHHQVCAENETLTAERAFPFEVRMPLVPWSYHGTLIKIRWTVRVRVYPALALDFGGDEDFVVQPLCFPPRQGGA